MFSGFPDPSLPGDPPPGETGGLTCRCGPGESLTLDQGGEAAPMSLQRLESEGNSYLGSFPLSAKIPKEIKRVLPIYDLQCRD